MWKGAAARELAMQVARCSVLPDGVLYGFEVGISRLVEGSFEVDIVGSRVFESDGVLAYEVYGPDGTEGNQGITITKTQSGTIDAVMPGLKRT